MELTRAIAKKVLKTVDAGLSFGLGVQEPGKMCVEAAVCFALGLPHGDNPPCVGAAVRMFKIRLNDSKWSSSQARSAGMRKLAIAQLGSDQIDQKEFVKLIAVEVIKQIVPIALRAAASVQKDQKHKDALEVEAKNCETEGTEKVASEARAATAAAAYAAYADAATAAAAYAAYADAAAAYAADATAADAKDKVLEIMANIAVSVLCKLGSVGCQWLDLCD